MKIVVWLCSLSQNRIAEGYAKEKFSVAHPFNPRTVNELGLSQLPGWFFLMLATALAQSWQVAFIAAAAIAFSMLSITLAEIAWVELPKNEEALVWQFENYGKTTRCGLWAPVGFFTDAGLCAPYVTLAALGLWMFFKVIV